MVGRREKNGQLYGSLGSTTTTWNQFWIQTCENMWKPQDDFFQVGEFTPVVAYRHFRIFLSHRGDFFLMVSHGLIHQWWVNSASLGSLQEQPRSPLIKNTGPRDHALSRRHIRIGLESLDPKLAHRPMTRLWLLQCFNGSAAILMVNMELLVHQERN